MDSTLRPRDIQTRIRSGETPEMVASAAGTTVERIMAFAAPVIAERQHISMTAQRASVRRRSGRGAAGVLGEAVARHLQSQGLDAEHVEWDAWRRDDGRWTVVGRLATGGEQRRGEFAYDAAGRYVVAEDDDARWLLGDIAVEEPVEAQPAPEPAGQRVPGSEEEGPRLAAVPLAAPGRAPEDEQLLLGEDALALFTDVSADRPAGSLELRADADAVSTPASTSPEAAPTQDPAQDRAPRQAPKSNRGKTRRGRASVPSWDEIMFGSGKAE